MPLIHDFPIEILTPKHPAFWPSGGVRAGTRSISQVQQFDALDGGPMWNARLIDIPIYCRERILLAQAIQSLAMSGVGIFDVPRIVAKRTPSLHPIGPGGSGGRVPHSDGTPFSDGALYQGSGMGAELRGGSGADLGAAVLDITFLGARPLIGGEEFSLSSPEAGRRLYRVMRVLETVEASATVEISPPLRDDYPAAAPLDFETPGCTMRMTNAETFLQALEWNEYADVTAEFEEAFF